MKDYGDANDHTDTCLSILSNKRRRIFIRYLADHEPVELRAVAQVISDIEDTSQKSAYTALSQTHVNPLLDADIIEESCGAKRYETGDNYNRAKLILDYLATV